MSGAASLDQIGLKHGTDKASSEHGYLAFYEHFFSSFRYKEITILELGILNGASLKTWQEYFPSARIVGADINPATKRFETVRAAVELLDQSNIEELTRLALKHGPFDIVIDDGSHVWDHQITSLRTLFPFVRHDGLYVVEDLQTNYGSLAATYRGVATSPCVDMLKRWLDLTLADEELPLDEVEDAFLRTYGRSASMLVFRKRACLIRKCSTVLERHIGPGEPLIREKRHPNHLCVQLLAHISNQGDVHGPASFINLAGDQSTFQGLSIMSGANILEVRVRSPDGQWGDWSQEGDFVGTRGQSSELTGIAVRLKKRDERQYKLRSVARFAGVAEPLEFINGEDCVSAGGQPICGWEIRLQATGPVMTRSAAP